MLIFFALLIFLAIIVLTLVCYVGFQEGRTRLFQRDRLPLESVDTDFGVFVKDLTSDPKSVAWHGEIIGGGRELQIIVTDVDGKPDPVFLMRLPAILETLPRLEQTARESVPALSNRFVPVVIANDIRATEARAESILQPRLLLGFFTQEISASGESVFVEFEGDQVVDHFTT